MVENTVSPESVAIEASPGTDPVLENVVVSGLLVGVPPQNIRDHVVEDDPAESIQISFLPPPPLSPASSSEPAGISVKVTHVSRLAQSSVSGPPPYSPFTGRRPAAVRASTTVLGSLGSFLHVARDPWKVFLISAAAALSIVIVLQYMELTRSRALFGRGQPTEKEYADQEFGDRFLQALLKGDYRMVRKMYAEGIDVNRLLSNGLTPLMMASAQGNFGLVQDLLDMGADVNGKNDVGWDALMAATQGGHRGVCLHLLNRGAEVNAVSDRGYTALGIARVKGYTEIVSLLKARDARR